MGRRKFRAGERRAKMGETPLKGKMRSKRMIMPYWERKVSVS